MQTREMIACESAADLTGLAIEGAAPLETGNVVTDDQPGIVIEDCTIIEGDRWGSSGYYPASVLERDGERVFHENLQVFLDHADPDKDSAERLLGHLAGPARYVVEDGIPKLKAPVRFFSDKANWVKERLKHLGLSIRAGITFENGTRAGRTGKIVTSFTQALSVDVVARAGAGGKFGSIKESEIISAVHQEEEGADVALSKEDATALAEAIGTALKPQFDAIATAVSESAKPKFKEYTPGALAKELSQSKLTEASQEQVWKVFEAKGDVETAIADAVAHEKQVAEAQQGRPDAHVTTGGGSGSATESDVPQGWGVTVKEGE